MKRKDWWRYTWVGVRLEHGLTSWILKITVMPTALSYCPSKYLLGKQTLECRGQDILSNHNTHVCVPHWLLCLANVLSFTEESVKTLAVVWHCDMYSGSVSGNFSIVNKHMSLLCHPPSPPCHFCGLPPPGWWPHINVIIPLSPTTEIAPLYAN